MPRTDASLPGDEVVATATYLGAEGKLHRFEVVATDSAGEVGRCIHTRAIVRTARLVEGAQKRAEAARR